MSCLAFPLSDEEPAYKPRSSPWNPAGRGHGACELASTSLCLPGLTGEDGLSVALLAVSWGASMSTSWVLTLQPSWGSILCWSEAGTLMIPNVLTFPGPELKALTTAAWIFLDFMGLPMRTGLYRLLLLWLGLSITLIQVNHHHFWDWFSLPTSELCPNTKFLRSLRSLRNKWGCALPNSAEILCAWEQSGMLFQWPAPHILGCCSPQSSYTGSSSCFLYLALKAPGEIIHLCKLLSRVCSAVLQRMGLSSRSAGRWRSYSPWQESQDRWSPIILKKYINLSLYQSPYQRRFSCYFSSDRYTFYQQETVSMIWRALGLQKLSNMANVHAYTGTEYCLIYLWVMNKWYVFFVKCIWHFYCSGCTFWSSSLSTRAFFFIT